MNDAVPLDCGLDVLDSLPYPVIVLDRTYRTLMLNQEAASLFNAPDGDLLGETIGTLCGLVDSACLERELRQAFETGDRVCTRYFDPVRKRWFHISAKSDPAGRLVISMSDASALRILEEELDSIEQKICAAFHDAALAVAVADENGWFLEANEAFLALTGYSMEELRARDFVTITHPEDRDRHLRAGLSILQDGRHAAVYEKRYVRKDGTTVWVRMNVSVLARPEGHIRRYLALCEDVTEARAGVEKLRLSENRFRALTERSLDLVSVISPEGTILYESPAIEAILGYTSCELEGRNVFDLIHPEDRQQVAAEIAAKVPVEGTTARMVFRFLHKDGTWRYLEGVGRSLLQDPAVRGIVANSRDITDRVETKRKLKVALDQAREATELKSRFLANMSHEIRTPMNGVVGLSDLLLGTDLTAEQREYVDGIQFSAEVLLHVINDILDFSKIEAGKLQVDAGPFDLRHTLAGAGDIFAPLCRAKSLDFRLTLTPEVPRMVLGDGLRLRQVLTNLLSNAVKFTAAGRVRLFADATVHGNGAVSLTISVSDTGIGIPAEQQRRLFSSFTQGDSSTTRKFGGTGLGLAISRQLLELMGGSIALHSVPGEGTEFSFELPLELVTPPMAVPIPFERQDSLMALDRC